jgi:hypothetical protein
VAWNKVVKSSESTNPILYDLHCMMLSQEEPSYTCPLCGRTSYNPNDIANQYCGGCHQFAEPFWMQDIRAAQRKIDAARLARRGPAHSSSGIA